MPIYQCKCQADSKGNPAAAQFQDRVYGPGRRVFTDTVLGTRQRCTVCGDTRTKGR